MATWIGCRRPLSGGPIRKRCGRKRRASSCLASIMGRTRIRWPRSGAARSGDDLGLRPSPRLPRRHQGPLEAACRLDRGASRRRRRSQSVRRHGAGDGKAAGAGCGSRLAGQAHQSRVAASSAPGCSSARSSPICGLPPDEAESDHCGACRACLDICPTKAFDGPYRLDARRCISYLTIEHKGAIPHEFRAAIGNRIYGCDDCLAVCPWNKFAKPRAGSQACRARRSGGRAARRSRQPRRCGISRPFATTPIKRIGHARFLRNVLVAIGNSRDHTLAPSAEAHVRHESSIVRQMAVWALSQLVAASAFDDLAARYLPAESNSDVRAEWQLGTGPKLSGSDTP